MKTKYLKIVTVILIFVMISLIVADGLLTFLLNNSNFVLKILELITSTATAVTISISFSLSVNTKDKTIENSGKIMSNGNQTIVNGNGNIINSNDLSNYAICKVLNDVNSSLEEIKRENQTQIIKKVCDELKKQNVQNSVDKDFMLKYLDEGALISNSDIQEIWAKLLISKSTNEQSVSKRTLDIVKDLTSDEAIIFENVASLVHYSGIIEKESCNEISFLDLSRLVDIGLLKTMGLTNKISINKNSSYQAVLKDTVLIIENTTSNDIKIEYECYVLSVEGIQLANSLNIGMSIQEQIKFANFIKSKSSEIKTHLYNIVNRLPDGRVQYNHQLDLI